uniref:Uncharacterized protein n=1 Tax=Sinocyclocheilus grahami TaxID=75366 RepID=A0A672NTA5_SINGR
MQKYAARDLIFFQYAGTKYSGMIKAPADEAVEGVENHLEVSLSLPDNSKQLLCVSKQPQIVFPYALIWLFR